MYIAMNRFRVAPGHAEDFEARWRSRERRLHELPGFIAFSLLKGAAREDHVLYASHTVWASKACFTNWTTSEQFRAAHANAGRGAPLGVLGHPEFEGFEAVLVEAHDAPRTAAE